MNIVHIISNKVWGGGERYALDLCTALATDGHSVAVICRHYPAVLRPFEQAGIAVGTLPLGGVLDLISPVRLSSVLGRMEAPVVVHVHNFKDAATAARARRLMREPGNVKIVCTRHLVKPGKDSRSARTLYDDLDAIIFVSELARQEFIKGCPGVDRRKLHVVYNSILPPDPAPVGRRPGDPFRFVYTGRISPEKGITTLIEAMSRLSDLNINLTICGTGRARDVLPLQRLADNLGLSERIKWAGHVADIYARISRADCGVLPTTAREAFGLSVIEFMSQGVPVISTDNGAQPEIITPDHDGLLVPPGDAAALAEAMRRTTESNTARQLGDNALSTFRNRFSYPRFYTQILSIYRQ